MKSDQLRQKAVMKFEQFMITGLDLFRKLTTNIQRWGLSERNNASSNDMAKRHQAIVCPSKILSSLGMLVTPACRNTWIIDL